MLFNFWMRTSGTWINVFAILIGSFFGILMRKQISKRMNNILTQGVGLILLWVGIFMSNNLANVEIAGMDGVILGLLSISLGGLLGEWLDLEEKLVRIGEWLKTFFRGGGSFTEGFVAASLLFCTGPMSLLGSIANGTSENNTLLMLKAIMDGFVSIPFASSYGIGVAFSSLSILIYQGGISLFAGVLTEAMSNPSADARIILVNGIGGLIIIGIGFNILEVTKIRIASFLPSFVVAPFLYSIIYFANNAFQSLRG
jgi:uncharacterized protein